MIDDVFAVIADTTRRQILRALANGARPVGELVDELGISQPTVSKHLKVLRNVGLVESQAAGQKRFYSLTPEPLEKIVEWIRSLQTETSNVSEEPIPTSESFNEQETTENLPSIPPAPPAPEPPQQAQEDQPKHLIEEPQDVSDTDSQDEEQGYFTLGEEGEVRHHVQPRHAHSILNLSPLEPFEPATETAELIDPTTSIDLGSIPLLAAEEATTQLDVVVIEEDLGEEEETFVKSQAEDVADVPDGYVTYTGEPDNTEFIDDIPEEEYQEEPLQVETGFSHENLPTSSTLNGKTETQIALENATSVKQPEPGITENHESRGLLASLTRWSRRRSR